MNHILDNPAWNALQSGNKHLGTFMNNVAWFDQQVSPFVALSEPRAELLPVLYQSVPFNGTVVLVSGKKVDISPQWQSGLNVPGFQMVYEGNYPEPPAAPGGIAALKQEHIPQMLALTAMTQPGPFLPRTIEFGHYEGIFVDDRLVAMAGQRLNPTGYAEISAVCTHPDHLGKGYARILMSRQMNRIRAAGQTPFLHVRQDNERAIGIYDSMGFAVRSEMNFYILTKK